MDIVLSVILLLLLIVIRFRVRSLMHIFADSKLLSWQDLQFITKSSSVFLLDGPEFRSSLYQDVPRKEEPLNIVIFVGGETVQPTGSAAQDWLLPAVRVRLQGCRLSSPQVLLPPRHHKIQCSYMLRIQSKFWSGPVLVFKYLYCYPPFDWNC